MISVIISTYNRPERLRKAIESVKAQTFKDWELIIIHDGFVPPLIDSNKKIKFFSIEHFGNDTKPKNTGISVSAGEYIALLDDDNIFRPDHLQSLYNAIKDTDLDMVYGDRWIVDETKRIPDQIGITSEFNPSMLFIRNYIDTSDVLIRRDSLFKVGGFDERYKKYVDWNLWLRMVKAGMKFKRVPLLLTDYHLHDDMKSVKVQTEGDQKTGTNKPEWDPYNCEVELNCLGEKQKPRVAIFSLTYDRLEYTKKCFESLNKTAGYEFDHYVIDNGSKDGTYEWLLQQHGLGKIHRYIANIENNGISVASNQALKIIGNDYDIIIKVDNDCLFLTKGWLAKMVEIWQSNHMIALSCYVQGLRDNPGGAPRIGYGQIKGEMLGMTQHLGGICVFADATAYKDFKWDDTSFLHGFQDIEFSQHLLNKGFQMAYLENFFLEHVDGTEGQENKYPEYFKRRKEEKQTRYAKE